MQGHALGKKRKMRGLGPWACFGTEEKDKHSWHRMMSTLGAGACSGHEEKGTYSKRKISAFSSWACVACEEVDKCSRRIGTFWV